MTKRSKVERLKLVLGFCKQLERFPKSHPDPDDLYPYINLYNDTFESIIQLKQIFHDYVHQNDDEPKTLQGFSGKILFPEIDRTIEYILPIKTCVTPLFVLRANQHQNYQRTNQNHQKINNTQSLVL